LLAVRTLLLNTVATLLRGETMTTEQVQKLIERVDRDKFRKVAERVEQQAARKKPQREKISGNGNAG
jgi:alpha-glucuronidase